MLGVTLIIFNINKLIFLKKKSIKIHQYLSFIKDPTTNIIPSVGTNLNVLVSIKKGSVSGITIYQETQHVTLLNSLKLTSNAPYISLNIGCADPNSLGYVGCSATYISGSTSGTPLFISSNNTINPTIDYSDNYYVHLDVTDLSSNVYYATNNDFNLKDSNNLIKFPSSASTQTLNINDIQTTLNNKFLKVFCIIFVLCLYYVCIMFVLCLYYVCIILCLHWFCTLFLKALTTTLLCRIYIIISCWCI